MYMYVRIYLYSVVETRSEELWIVISKLQIHRVISQGDGDGVGHFGPSPSFGDLCYELHTRGDTERVETVARCIQVEVGIDGESGFPIALCGGGGAASILMKWVEGKEREGGGGVRRVRGEEGEGRGEEGGGRRVVEHCHYQFASSLVKRQGLSL